MSLLPSMYRLVVGFILMCLLWQVRPGHFTLRLPSRWLCMLPRGVGGKNYICPLVRVDGTLAWSELRQKRDKLLFIYIVCESSLEEEGCLGRGWVIEVNESERGLPPRIYQVRVDVHTYSHAVVVKVSFVRSRRDCQLDDLNTSLMAIPTLSCPSPPPR